MISTNLPKKLRVKQVLRLNVRIIQTFGLLPENVLTANRGCHNLRKAFLYPVVFISIHFILGSVFEPFLPSEDSQQISVPLMLILCFIKGPFQLYVLIFSEISFSI